MQDDFQIYGIRAIIEAIQANRAIDKIFIQKGLRGDLFQELENLAQEKGINVAYVPFEKLKRLSRKNHQGAVAHVSPVEFKRLEDLVSEVLEKNTSPFFLLLDKISDVRNFGAIIRTAECSGVSGIIIPKKGNAPVTADTVKTSAGAVFKMPIAKVDHIKDAIYYLQGSDIKVLAATEKTEKFIYDITLKGPCAIVMGAEDKGISPSVLKIVDYHAKLPLMGDIDSLNVSVACAVMLYEIVRQRNFKS